MIEGLVLETHLLSPAFKELFVFPLCCRFQFFKLTFLFSISQLLLPAMCLSPQFTNLDSFWNWFVLYLMWSSSPQFRQILFVCILFFCIRICGFYDISCAGLGTCIQGHLMVVRGYRDYMPYGCSCKLKVRSTAIALEFFGLMKLAFFAFSMNGYASFMVLLNSSLNS